MQAELRCSTKTIQRYQKRVAVTSTVALGVPLLPPLNALRLEQWALDVCDVFDAASLLSTADA